VLAVLVAGICHFIGEIPLDRPTRSIGRSEVGFLLDIRLPMEGR
jgi:hypothetical protein